MLKWIQENTKFYAHYKESSVVWLETKTPNYDLTCLELTGIDAVKFVQWLVEGSESFLPQLNRKLARILGVKTDSVREVEKVPIEFCFKSKTRKKWTNDETEK